MGQQQTTVATDPLIRQMLEELDAVMLDFHALCDSLTEEQLNWKPDERRWSIAQCLEHVTMTLQLYPREVERMIAEARARAAAGARPYRDGYFAGKIITSQEPPPRMRIRTMRRVEPASALPRDRVIDGFVAAHQKLRELIMAADGVPLNQGRMRSPFVSLLQFTLRQALQVNLAHARRHLWQARQVRQEPSFPL